MGLIDRKAIDELPVMELEPGQPVPQGVEVKQRAFVKHVIQDGKLIHETAGVESIVGRSQTQDIFYVPRGQNTVGVISHENLMLYSLYK